MIVASWMFEFTVSDVTSMDFQTLQTSSKPDKSYPRLHKCKRSILFCMVKLALMCIIEAINIITIKTFLKPVNCYHDRFLKLSLFD